MGNRFDFLRSPLFLVCLSLLLLNDFYLKDAFHNYLTGKLSDFAGLAAFAMFWSVVFPKRARVVYTVVALFFVCWKLPVFDPFIDFWNSFGLISFSRAKDPADLMALGILPIAYYFQFHHTLFQKKVKVPVLPIILVSSFAFVATSRDEEPLPTWSVEKTYIIDHHRRVVIDTITSEGVIDLYITDDNMAVVQFFYTDTLCDQHQFIRTTCELWLLTETSTKITTKTFSANCTLDNPELVLINSFRKEVIGRFY